MASTSTGERRPRLYDVVISQHRGLRERLRALNQARYDGYDPAENERMRTVLWAIHDGGRR